jgi:hypothetical protein
MENVKDQLADMVHVQCCICESDNSRMIGSGKDFEYNTSSDIFLAVKCDSCGLVYLNPRPDVSEFETIYPGNYHAIDFSEDEFGVVYKIRSWLEARRLLNCCNDLPEDAKILDVGCGDGFHLKLLRQYGKKNLETRRD